MQEKNELDENALKKINRALGVFVTFFGTVVLVSIFFTESFLGKMTNLGAGIILVGIGAIMVLQARTKSHGNSSPDKD